METRGIQEMFETAVEIIVTAHLQELAIPIGIGNCFSHIYDGVAWL